MSELIERQAAIDAAKDWYEGLICGSVNGLIKKLKALPTIQPEVLACGNGELITKLEPQWIPIAERLPKDGTWNIFTDGKNISVERYKADAIDHFFPNGRWFQLEDVIAWMPLPEPYRGGVNRMDDLISRQAALEKVRAMQTYKLFVGDDMILVDKAEVQTRLMMLPTAQPEPHWIPVSERLPEIGKYVLCYLKSRRYFGHYRVCIYRAADKYINHPYFDFNENGFPDVIAWMPLPEAYNPNK